MSPQDGRAVFAAIRRHLPHIAALVETAARRLFDEGFEITPRNLRRATLFEYELRKAFALVKRGEGA